MNIEIKNKISREFAHKRGKALADAAARKRALYAQCPSLGELDAEAASLSVQTLKERLSGKAGSDYKKRLDEIAARRAQLMEMMHADIEPHFSCPNCQDTGRTKEGYCNCFVARVIEENLANANLSITSTHERFETFDLGLYSDRVNPNHGISPRQHMTSVLARCKRFVSEFDKGTKNLLLVGTPGLGKTFLSSAIAHALLEQGKTVIYLSAAEFSARVQANKFGDQPQEMMPYYEADLLILDDLGTEFRTQLTASVLGEVIDRRLRSGKKMVFSTNLTLHDMEKQYPARIISRFMGAFDYLQFLGSDLRLKGK